MSIGKQRNESIVRLIASLVIIVSLNVIGSFLFFRLDLTSEKRYSLSEASRELAGSLKDVVYIKVYLDGELPPGFRRLRTATREMLDEFRIYAGSNLEYEFIDPSAETDEKKRLDLYKQLAKKGLMPTNLEEREKGGSSQKIIFPGAIAAYGNEEIPVQLLKSRLGSSPEEMLNASVENLEYEIAGLLRRFTRTGDAPRIGFLRGHGELDNKHISDAARALNEYYNVDTVVIGGRLDALRDHRLIIIAKPTQAFDEKDKFVLDQFIVKGGRVLWLIDRMQAEMDSLSQTGTTVAIPYELNLDDQLFRYGARINTDLVMDLLAAPIPVVTGYVGNQPKQELMPWYYFPLLESTDNHPIVRNLNAVKTEFPSSIDTIDVPGIRKTVLLAGSQYCRLQLPPARISMNILQQEPDPATFPRRHVPIVLLLEGKFRSLYENRLPDTLVNNPGIGFKALGDSSKMIVAGDGNLIESQVSKKGTIYPLGFDRFSQQQYGNRNFILNAADYLCDDTGVLALRAKEFRLRLLDAGKLNEQGSLIRWANVGIPLAVLWLFGWLFQLNRRRRYQRK